MSTDRVTQDITETASDTPEEKVMNAFFFACALLSVITTVSIVLLLASETVKFFDLTAGLVGYEGDAIGLADFFLGTNWAAGFKPYAFGVVPLVFNTLVITIGAAVVAMPLGLATAIYLSEYASKRKRAVLKPALEILAGIPTVVYGFFALVYVTPFLDSLFGFLNNDVPGLSGTVFNFPELGTFNALSASIIVGIMIIPMVSSISEDAMSAVPADLRRAGYGMGATKFDVSVGIVVPAAVSGIASSFILALSRAIGETMIVAIAAGSTPTMPAFGQLSVMGTQIPYPNFGTLAVYFEPVMPMTSAMVNIATGDMPTSGVAYHSLFAVGFTLFAMTLVMNVISDFIASRYREEYE
ncbi:phosphate ABC transporter permease subunit PstC [Haloarchaeobius sp. TZWSO28]|uniref:phosphate ABC transporter permease subunit PstC n=1 Tax=Haloarchaeobius sp. TZWSO28 TaxID=3446119 RepID=UPI003EBFB487